MSRSLRAMLKDLYATDPRVRWAAVRDVGAYAAAKGPEDPRGVRELVRRFTWALSDESGATPWGAPECVAEICVRVPELRGDFAPLFLGWLEDEEVVLDNAVLDAGAVWGIGRLGAGPPFDPDDLARVLPRFLAHPSPHVRGAAAYAAGRHSIAALRPALEARLDDEAPAVLLLDGEVVTRSVAEFASAALAAYSG